MKVEITIPIIDKEGIGPKQSATQSEPFRIHRRNWGERTNLLVNLVEAVTAHTSTAAARKRPKRAATQPALPFVTFGSFAAMEQAHQLNFLVNDMLAFLNFPMGLNESNTPANLKGLYDTGGCCNMGKKDYHLAIAKNIRTLSNRSSTYRRSATLQSRLDE